MLRRFWRSTFGLVVMVSLAFALATLVIGMSAYSITHAALEEQLDHRIQAETTALLEEAHEEGLDGVAAAILQREVLRSTASLDYLLVDAGDRRLAGKMEMQVPAIEGHEEFLHYVRDGKPGIARALITRIQDGILVVAADREGVSEIDQLLTLLFGGALATMLLLGIGAAALVGLTTRHRLARIAATAQAIIGGDLAQRVPRDGSDGEFDRLAGTLNRMLDRITALMDNLRQVSGDIAHDLRTPLTRLYQRLDHALAESDPHARHDAIDAARAQASELLEIFGALLRITEVEGMAERLPRQTVDISSLVEQMVDTYSPDMEASGHLLQCFIAPGLTLQGDRRLLSQAIANLLDNALRHTPTGTCVALSLEQTAGQLQLAVADDGPGVAGADMNRLFQRFARAERSRSTPGYGLGLALVAAVATAHGGQATLAASHGFKVVITLPGT